MYILECLIKWLFPQKLPSEYNYNPLNYDDLDDEDCQHEFMPVDSTGETLACIKCGFIVQRSKSKIINEDK